MLGDVGLNLVHDMVADAAILAALLLLLAAEILSSSKSVANSILRMASDSGRFPPAGQQLLQQALDVVLLLDRDVGEQMVVLFVQEREEIHLRKMSIILSRYSRLKFITIRLEAVSPSEAVL